MGISKPIQLPQPAADESEDDIEDMMGMVEDDDLDFLKSAVSNKSYRLLDDAKP